MGINKRRLLIVLVLLTMLTVGGGAAYFRFVGRKNESASLQASAVTMLEEGKYESASVEIEKLLRAKPRSGQAHFLKAQALLAGRKTSELAPSDSTSIAAVRSLLQAVQFDPKLVEPRRLLIDYFVSTGQITDAAEHGRRILDLAPKDLDGQYAVATQLLLDKPREAGSYVERMLVEEKPLRPRTIWLAAQVGDNVRGKEGLASQADRWVQANADTNWPVIIDRLSLVELRAWHARRSNDSATVERQIATAVTELRDLAKKLSTSNLSPRLIVRTATRLLPPKSRRGASLAETYAKLEPTVDGLIDDVFRLAADAQVLDPILYLGQASRLRSQGRNDAAIALLKDVIDLSQKAGGDSRTMFAQCDLWLAEHYLDEGKGDLAEPHIQVLLGTEYLRPMGEMLAGFRTMQQGDFDTAFRHLSTALPKLPENGAAHALLGLCQLRRGMISEGRQQLETGIRLGAQSPRYKAWLALALAEGGYNDQAISVAKEVLESPDHAAVGRALLGQLRLHSGDFQQAAADLQAAYESADAAFQPSIQLSQAELALVNGEPDKALGLIETLKGTTLAPQAYALQYRHLRRMEKVDVADAVLREAREKHSESTLLLAIEVQRLIELERFSDAESLLGRFREKDPSAVAPILLLTEVFEQAGEPKKAIALLQESSSRMREEASLRVRLVEKHLAMRDFAEAGKLLEQIKSDPNFNATTVDYLFARSAALQGDMESAQQYIERAASKDPDNPTLKFLMGQLAAKRGDYSTASTLFEQSLAGAGHRSQAVQALFESLLRLGDTTKAVELLSRAEKRGQKVQPLRVQLLRLLARQEDWGALESEVNAILSRSRSEEDYLLVVSAFRYVHQPAMAKKYLERALREFPSSSAMREQEASLLLEVGDFENGEKRLRSLLAEQPENAMLHVLHIYLLDKTNRPDMKRQAIEEAWRKCPGHPAVAALYVQSLLRDGKTDEAISFAEKAKQAHPKLPDPRYLVARMQESIGNDAKALAMLGVLVAEDPTDQRAAEHYFRLLVTNGLPKEVAPAIEKLVSSHPDNSVLVGAMAEYLALQGDLAGAEQTISKLQGIEAKGAMTEYAKAVLAFARQDLKEAERLVRISMADPRGHVPGTFLLARIRAAEGRYADASSLAARVCRQQPRNPTAHIFYARLLSEIGDLEKSESVCREFLKREKGDRSARLLLARTLLSRGGVGRLKEAGQIAWEVYQEGIRGPDELESVMNILFAAGQSDRCREIATGLESKGGSPENLLAVGRSSFIAGDYSTASRLADQVLVTQPDNTLALLLAADTETRVAALSEDDSHFEKAVRLYERVVQKDPKNLAAANNLAWTLGVSLGKEHTALTQLLRLVPAAAKPSPTVPTDILDTVGTLYLRQKKLEQSREYFESIVQREPTNAVACFRLGQIDELQGRSARAEQSYARAMKLAPTENWGVRKAEAGKSN